MAMTTIEQREAEMVRYYAENVPEALRIELGRKGFNPVLDAGNLWFLDRGNIRLTFGEDGSDLPQALDDGCEAYDMTRDVEEGPVAQGTLREVLEALCR